MKNIRCCIVNPKEKYRGIDREVDGRIFNNVKDKDLYNQAFDKSLKYLH